MHCTNDCVRFNREKLIKNESSVKAILEMLREMKTDMGQFFFLMKMDSVDISEYFPLSDSKTLEEFFDWDHEDWPLRQKGFYHPLYTTVTRSKRNFGTWLLHTLFTRRFIAENNWPTTGLVFLLKKCIFFYFNY